jgi:hypothetical protein
MLISRRSAGDNGLPSSASRIVVQARVVRLAAANPDFWRAIKMRPRGLEYIGKLAGEDDVVGLGEVDAMGQRLADKLRVDERDHAADLADAKPGGDVIRPARHQQANRVAFFNSRRQRPTGILVDPLRQRSVAEGFRLRDQGGPIRLPRRPVVDQIGKQRARIGLDAGGELDRFQPALGGRRFCARRLVARRPLDDAGIARWLDAHAASV